MARRGKRTNITKLASLASKKLKQQINDKKKLPLKIYLACLLTGISVTSAVHFLLHMGIATVSTAAVFAVAPVVSHAIISYTIEELENEKKQVQQCAVLSMDGSYGTRRNSTVCVIELIDNKTNKIVDYEVVHKNNKRRNSEYTGSSKGMEVYGAKKLIERWKNNENVKYLVHDQDAAVSKVIRDSGWNIVELFDTNHCMKSWNIFLTRLNKEAIETLNKCIAKGKHYIIKCKPNLGSTQGNESFHNVKSKYLSKRTEFPFSSDARIALSVLDYNHVENFAQNIKKKLGIEVDSVYEDALKRIDQTKKKQRNKRNTKTYQKATAIIKDQKRQANIKEDKETIFYNPGGFDE